MPSEKAKMLAGELYDADDPELTAEHRRARERTDRYNDTSPDEEERRRRLLDELFGSVGDDVTIRPPFRCDYGYNIHVGDEFFANYGCVVLDVCRVDIGDHCMFGPGVDLYTATHPVDPEVRRTGLESGAPISIGDDVWIGGRAVVNPGVTIGDGVVVGSGAVVTEDVPDGVVVQGNPAEIVGEVD